MADIKKYMDVSEKELNAKIDGLKKEIVVNRFKLAANQLNDTAAIQKSKKEIARIKTAINSKK